MFRRALLSVFFVVWVGLPACSYVVEPDPDAYEGHHTQGTITEVPSRLGTYAFLIEEKPDRTVWHGAGPLVDGDKFHVGISEETKIQRRTSEGGVRRASLEEITAGMQAEVWFVGPILESYPAQGTAGRILLLDPAP